MFEDILIDDKQKFGRAWEGIHLWTAENLFLDVS